MVTRLSINIITFVKVNASRCFKEQPYKQISCIHIYREIEIPFFVNPTISSCTKVIVFVSVQ